MINQAGYRDGEIHRVVATMQLKMLPGNYPSILGSDLGYYVDFSWPGIHHMDGQW